MVAARPSHRDATAPGYGQWVGSRPRVYEVTCADCDTVVAFMKRSMVHEPWRCPRCASDPVASPPAERTPMPLFASTDWTAVAAIAALTEWGEAHCRLHDRCLAVVGVEGYDEVPFDLPLRRLEAEHAMAESRAREVAIALVRPS